MDSGSKRKRGEKVRKEEEGEQNERWQHKIGSSYGSVIREGA